MLRLLLLAMLIFWAVAAYGSSAPILLISPLFVLGLIALLAYSFLPALYGAFPVALSFGEPISTSVQGYPNGLGERLVLQFVAFCLLLTTLLQRYGALGSTAGIKPRLEGNVAAMAIIVAAAILALLAIDVALATVPALSSLRNAGLVKQLADGLEPLVAMGITILAFLAAQRGKYYTALFLGLACLYLATRSMINLLQMPVFIVMMSLGFYLITRIRRGRGGSGIRVAALVLATMAVIVTIVAFGLIQSRYQWSIDRGYRGVELVKVMIYGKVFLRQGVSAACYNTIVTKHRPDATEERPFYFLSAVVPRVFWPDKPNLSRGHEYSWAYCGSKSLPEAPHYELVTLLAEPVLMGGLKGLVAAQAFLGVSLVLIALFMVRGGPLTLIVLVALLPWLIHFQQSFALYFANAVKMFIYMSPALLAFWWATRRKWSNDQDAAP